MNFPTLFYVAFLSYAAPVIAGGGRMFVRHNKIHRTLFLYSLSMFLLLLFEFALASNGINNHFVININFLVEVFFIVLLLRSSAIDRKIRIAASSVFLLLMSVWFASIVQYGVSYINEVFIIISRLLFIGLSLVVVAGRYRGGSVSIHRTSFFWVVFGILSYYSGTILVTGLFHQLIDAGQELFYFLWSVNWILAAAGNAMFTAAFFFRREE